MTTVPAAENRIMAAIDRLKAFDRRGAVALLWEEVAHEAPFGDRWRSVSRLASHIGELNLSLEAARRYARTPPPSREHILAAARDLVQGGRIAEAREQLNALPTAQAQHSSVLHFRGTIATQLGEFAEAEALFRQALQQTPSAPQSWFALSVLKTFTAGDPDIAAMEGLKSDIMKAPPRFAAQFCYALAKAYDDAGDRDRAYTLYNEGAALMRREQPFDAVAWHNTARQFVDTYTAEKLALLTPSGCRSERAIFVNGLPRSGTTLVEQILCSHSDVVDGAELNLMRAALIPTDDYSLLGALNYQLRPGTGPDPWGDIGNDYLQMIAERFGPDGRIVDKTLNHSRFAPLLFHTLPNARMIWLRRRPEDCALSCFRTFFASDMPWTWSPEDIASYFRSEDMLFDHWMKIFPDRILAVPYEDLTRDPQTWIRKILHHVGLTEQPDVFEPHKLKRSVITASVAQVRRPISAGRIGAADGYGAFTDAVRRAYHS